MASTFTRPLLFEHVNETYTARGLHRDLAAVNITEVPVLTMDRELPPSEQADLARRLFRKLGLRGIGVAALDPVLSRVVEITMPRRRDFSFVNGQRVPGCPASSANTEARERLIAVLLAAFPNHDNRSDPHAGRFDFRWFVS